MGKGDRRTAKGKRFKGSFGNVRPHKKKKKNIAIPKMTSPLQPAETETAPAASAAMVTKPKTTKKSPTAETTEKPKRPARKKKSEE